MINIMKEIELKKWKEP